MVRVPPRQYMSFRWDLLLMLILGDDAGSGGHWVVLSRISRHRSGQPVAVNPQARGGCGRWLCPCLGKLKHFGSSSRLHCSVVSADLERRPTRVLARGSSLSTARTPVPVLLGGGYRKKKNMDSYDSEKRHILQNFSKYTQLYS